MAPKTYCFQDHYVRHIQRKTPFSIGMTRTGTKLLPPLLCIKLLPFFGRSGPGSWVERHYARPSMIYGALPYTLQGLRSYTINRLQPPTGCLQPTNAFPPPRAAVCMRCPAPGRICYQPLWSLFTFDVISIQPIHESHSFRQKGYDKSIIIR